MSRPSRSEMAMTIRDHVGAEPNLAGRSCKDRWVRTVSNQKGVALPLALFALLMLSGLLLAFLSMAGMEPTIAANLGDVTGARYIADAGIEWTFDQLVLNSNWSQILATNGGTLATNMTLPGLTTAAGTFAVTVRNDIQPNDSQITGKPLDTGTATTDNNQIVIVTSTGVLPNGTTRQIQVVVSRVSFDPVGAVSLTGVKTKADLPGNMEIYGLNTLAGSSTEGDDPSCASKYAMTIPVGNPPGSNEAAFEPTLNPANLGTGSKAKIEGKPQDPNKPGEALNTIAEDANLTSARVTEFVNAIKGRADIRLTSTPAAPLEYSNSQMGTQKGVDGTIGPSCATNWNSPTCWGTPSRPKVVYVQATTPNPNQPFNPASLEVSEIQGAGILIVEDGTLFLNGAPDWQGIIIVTGRKVGFRICCGRTHDVWGSIIINETDASDPVANWEFTAGQHSNIYYSCQAIRNALSARATTRVTNWREL